jgi:hypothetical protein
LLINKNNNAPGSTEKKRIDTNEKTINEFGRAKIDVFE